jgi:hypothetical protein
MCQSIASAVHICASLALVIWLSTAVLAQESSLVTSPTITAAATAEQVRFISFDKISHIRLEVFALSGEQLVDSAFKPGDLLDWDLRDQQGQKLADGSYLCVVTVKDLAGRLSQRHGLVSLAKATGRIAAGSTRAAISGRGTGVGQQPCDASSRSSAG